MAERYSAGERKRMELVRNAARYDAAMVCWVCGSRPVPKQKRQTLESGEEVWVWVEEWVADHVYPLLGEAGELAAACASCNKRRAGKLPTINMKQRLFHSDRVVRSCLAEDMAAVGKSAAVRLFGSEGWLDLLIAAVDGMKYVYHQAGSKAKLESDKLASVLGRLG